MRLFLAINLEASLRREIVEATTPLRAVAPSVRWTPEDNLHLTLRFLGEQDAAAADRLRDAAGAVAARHRPFAMRMRHVGAFPNFRRARVVWLGVEQDPRLELLHHDLELACDARGFGLEGRAFRPHVTLARVPKDAGRDSLRELSRAARRVALDAETTVSSIDLMRSVPGPGGSRYERLHASPLGAA